MLRDDRIPLSKVPSEKLSEIVEKLGYGSLEVFPIYECVKVFARLNSDSSLTYARSREDIHKELVTAEDVSSRLKSDSRSSVVLTALQEFEAVAKSAWPFAPGSSSWIQLEILHPEIKRVSVGNAPKIVVRRACRLSTGRRVTSSSSPLIERMFSRMSRDCPLHTENFEIVFSPSVRLKSMAGKGIVSEVKAATAVGDTTVIENFCDELLRENGLLLTSPGFYFLIDENEYRVVSTKYSVKKDAQDSVKAAIPIAGWVK
jgi:hypothetical protein